MHSRLPRGVRPRLASSLSGGRPGATQLLPLLLAVASGYPGPARCALHPPADSLARLGASARGAWSCKKGGLGEQVSTGFLGWGWRASEPGRPALTFLQLFLVVRLWLGGHDLKEGLQDAPQVAGVVGLQLVGHACGGRGEGRGGTADCGACCGSGPEASPSLDEPGREAAPQPRKGPSGRSQVQEVREEGMGPRPSSAAPFPPGQQLPPGEGNGNPLQYSCLETPKDRGAWWITIHGVAKSQTQQLNILAWL